MILPHDVPYFGKHTFFFQMKGRTKLTFIQDEIKVFTFKSFAKSLVKKESYFLSSYISNEILFAIFFTCIGKVTLRE